MALLPIKIPPGFFRNGTQYQAKNRWYDGNLVRFSEGRLRPIGGWQRLAETQINKKGGIETLTITTAGTGYSSGTLAFSGGGGTSFTGTYTVGTVNGVAGVITGVAITASGTGFTSVPTITISGSTSGTAAVITATFYSGVDPIRGLHSWRLSTGARYLAIGSVQSLRIWDGAQSAGVNSPIYDITPSSSPGSAIPFHKQKDFQISGLGYGSLEYGGDNGVTNFDGSTGSSSGGDIYGTPRYPPEDPDVTDADAFRDNFASVVSFDNFGDDLLACHSGEGTIWHWSLSTGGNTTGTFTTTTFGGIATLVQFSNSNRGTQNTPLSDMWQSDLTHTNVAQTSTSGSGTGARFSIETYQEDYFGTVSVTTAGIGYEVGDTILVTDPGNTTNTATFTVASISAATVTSTAHGLSDTNIVQVSSAGDLPSGLPAYTDLYVRDKTTDTFRLATSSGGTAMSFDLGSGTHTWVHRTGGAIAFNNANQTATAPVALQTLTNSTGVPTSSNVAVLVTPERHIMILGPGGAQRKIQWGSQESLIDFTPTLVNTSGDLELQTKGRIIGGFKTRYGVLIFTTSDVWRTNYLGPPYVYGAERLTEGAGPVGMKCIAGSADFVAWMSRGRFWSYTGGYIKELNCDVADYVFNDINLDVEGLIAAGHNAEFGEIIWFYPREGNSVCTRYVTYSYREEHWTTGQLERTALEPSDALGYPVWAGSDGYLYRHEMDPDTQGVPIPRDTTVVAPVDISALSAKANRVVAKGVSTNTHPNVATENHLCYAETGAIEIASGNKMMSVKQILTDTDSGDNGLRMEVVTGKTPDAPGSTHGPFTLESDGYSDCRFTDRQAFLKVSSPFDQSFRFGEIRFNASASGER